MINDIVSVSIIAITSYFMVYGFYAVFTDILKGKKK